MDPLNKPDNYDINASMPTTTHFGYQSVPLERKEQLVGEVFAKVADKYDLMNDLMSAGVHRLWKRHFIDVLSPGADTKLLDVAGGTGDIAFRFIEAARQASQVDSDVPYSAKVTVADINPSMLRVGQQRADQLGYQSCMYRC
jgi:2-methoxy-6-polyprenyl-1,4-benzoquinol methylase